MFSGPPEKGTQSELATSPLPSQGPRIERNGYITPAFSGVPNKGDKLKTGDITLAFSGPRTGRKGLRSSYLISPSPPPESVPRKDPSLYHALCCTNPPHVNPSLVVLGCQCLTSLPPHHGCTSGYQTFPQSPLCMAPHHAQLLVMTLSCVHGLRCEGAVCGLHAAGESLRTEIFFLRTALRDRPQVPFCTGAARVTLFWDA